MATLTDKYAVPTNIRWAKGGSTGNTGGGVDVPSGGATANICWTSSYKTFQCQWRTRARKSPSAAILVDPTGADVWSDWGNWQGANIDTDATSAVTISGSDVKLTAAESWSYSISTEDLIEYEVRVRVINTSNVNVSDWAYGTLVVSYAPTITLTSCSEDKDGATVTLSTGWPRPLRSLRTSRYQRVYDATVGTLTQIGVDEAQHADGTDAGSISWHEPQKHVVDYNGGKAVICHIDALTGDIAHPTVGLTIDHGYWVMPGDDALTITVTTSSTDWDSVLALVTWTDGMGRTGQVDAELVSHTTGRWTLQAWAPPFDVVCDVRVSVTKGAGWKTASTTATVPSNGRASFVRQGGDEVAILYDLAHSQTIEPAVEVVQLADGRSVERRGLGALREFDVAGRYITDEQSQADFEPLRSQGGWVLRLPLGIRCPVAIQSVTVGTDAAFKLRAVSVQCAEVAE